MGSAGKLLQAGAGFVLAMVLSLGIVIMLLLGALSGFADADSAACSTPTQDQSMMGWPSDRHEIDTDWSLLHQGYDFQLKENDKVYASQDGEVVKAADREVRIRVESVETRYKFLKSITVSQGAKVKRGDQIGTVGNGDEGTDGNGTPIGLAGVHLHWEMWADPENKNEWKIVPKPEENLFELDTSKGGACSCGDGNLTGTNNQQKAFNFLVQNGFSKEQAAGIVGNMIAESGVEPMRLQNTPPGTETKPSEVLTTELGWGIVQWTPARKMVNAARDDGVPDEQIASLGYQLEFLMKQLFGPGLDGEAGPAVKAATTVEEAAYEFGDKFERFGGHEDPNHPTYADRKANARHVFEQFAGSAPASGGAQNAGTGGCGAGSGNIAEVAKNLAWPSEDHNTQPYKEAATDAYRENFYKYNKSAPDAGDVGWTDCGRFVATVMHMSGADPDYPDVWTPAQEAYLRSSPKYEVHDDWDESKLQPGDILIGPGHTYLYVGPWADGHNSASASLDGDAPGPGHVPEATNAYEIGTTYAIARLKK